MSMNMLGQGPLGRDWANLEHVDKPHFPSPGESQITPTNVQLCFMHHVDLALPLWTKTLPFYFVYLANNLGKVILLGIQFKIKCPTMISLASRRNTCKQQVPTIVRLESKLGR